MFHRSLLVAMFSVGLAVLQLSAADHPAAKNWKVPLPVSSDETVYGLFNLSQTDKGWVGDWVDISEVVTVGKGKDELEIKIDSVTVKDDEINIVIDMSFSKMTIDGKLSKDGKKIFALMKIDETTKLIELSASSLKNFKDRLAFRKEQLDQLSQPTEYIDGVERMIPLAADKLVKTEELRPYIEKAGKLLVDYGVPAQRTTAITFAKKLATHEPYMELALDQVKLAERLLRENDEPAVQIEVVEALIDVLTKAKKLDDVKPLQARLLKLEIRDYANFMKLNPLKVTKFDGRTSKSDRVVLLEYFTGAENPSAVSGDWIMDTLSKSYTSKDVVILQYHGHFGGLDPLAPKEFEDRMRDYTNRTAPKLYIDGKAGPDLGGPRGAARKRLTPVVEAVNAAIEKDSAAKLKLSAEMKDGEITIKANVSGVEKPGEKIKLRLVLVEDRARYEGANGMRYHHSLVRNFPGGVKGFAITEKTLDKTVSVKVEDVRTGQIAYLKELASKVRDANLKAMPVELRNLRVVAFVQNEEGNEVLQSAQVEVEVK